MDSRGGITGGATIQDFIAEFERRGYDGQFVVRPGGFLECAKCHERTRADSIHISSIRRVEGVSDPADMSAIGAMSCPHCGARGTATFCFGTRCPPEDGEVLRLLDQRERPARQALVGKEDPSLVRDTGWLR